jgi:eukaryotic-like serine/threonine-protein kinase
MSFDPEYTPVYTNQAFSQIYLDRPEDAAKTVRQAFARKLQIPELLLAQYLVAHQKGDEAVMDQTMSTGQGKPGAEDWLLHVHSMALARSGKLTSAREASERAVQSAETAREQERAATYEAALAAWEALYENPGAARAKAKEALRLSNGRDTEYVAAFALAICGDTASAKELAKDLKKRFPEDTSVTFNYLPALHGMFALRRGAPTKAIGALQPAAPYEFAASAVAFNYFFGNFYPVYARAQALLAAGRPSEAAAEFNKILTHRGLLMVDPLDAIARLQLARAYTRTGDPAKAKAAYTDLFSIWKDADRDLPLVMQARAEFAKFQ